MSARERRRQAALKRLRALYAQVPDVGCKGMCANSCGPIGLSALEREQVERRGRRPLRVVEHPTQGPLTCSMLTAAGRCRVYSDRPMVCRLWGAVPEMPCPWGCRPERPLRSGEGKKLMLESLRIGGAS